MSVLRIGIVTTWLERGAAYVSYTYMKLLQKEGHTVFIYARGGESHESRNNPEWNADNVTRSDRYRNTKIPTGHFFKWIKDNGIEALLFNEQREYSILPKTKRQFPNVKLGAYVDYYTEDTIKYYDLFDFLICNTKRHMQAMEKHKQKYYIEWGTDIDLYRPQYIQHDSLTFFHSAGMSQRKGTDILVNAFIHGKLYINSSLIIHTQVPIEKLCNYTEKELEQYGISIIQKTVAAPGLYHLGDVYVYPTRLDGLGLTMYEALSCGLPMITTDFPPMSEVGNGEIVKRVKVKDFYCRADAYYYPMCVCDEEDLIQQMLWFIENKSMILDLKNKTRKYAEDHYNIETKSKAVSEVFLNATIQPFNIELERQVKNYYANKFNLKQWIGNYRIVSNAIR